MTAQILQKLAATQPNTPLTFKRLLSSQLGSQLSKRDNLTIASEITVSRFRLHKSLKAMFANSEDFANAFLLQLARKTAFPAADLRQFFDTTLHAQGLDAYAQSAKQQYQQARAQLDSALTLLTPEKGELSLAQASKAQVALTTTLSTIKTAKAKLSRSFSSIPKDFIFLLLPLYRQWVKTAGIDQKAKRSFLNAISWALIERQITTLSLPKDAKIKRIQALRIYLKSSGMLEKIWLALKQANLSFPHQAPHKGTLNQVAKIYQECEAVQEKFKFLQARIKSTLKLCQSLAKELYREDKSQARFLVQQTVNIHRQYIACKELMNSSYLTLPQIQGRIEGVHENLDKIMADILNHKSDAYSRSVMQRLSDFVNLMKQNLRQDALLSLFAAPLRDPKNLASLFNKQTLVQELMREESTLLEREKQPENSSNVVHLFDHAAVIATQFTQSKQTTAKDKDNHQHKEAAVFAPKLKT